MAYPDIWAITIEYFTPRTPANDTGGIWLPVPHHQKPHRAYFTEAGYKSALTQIEGKYRGRYSGYYRTAGTGHGRYRITGVHYTTDSAVSETIITVN